MPDIRPARAGDADAVSALLSELGYPTGPDIVARRLGAMERTDDVVLVATEGESVVGLATVHVTPVLHRPTSVGRITALVVSDGARGRGVGRALVEHAERIVAERGCTLIEVTSNTRRTQAHRFYEQLGYAVTSLRFKKDLGRINDQV